VNGGFTVPELENGYKKGEFHTAGLGEWLLKCENETSVTGRQPPSLKCENATKVARQSVTEVAFIHLETGNFLR